MNQQWYHRSLFFWRVISSSIRVSFFKSHDFGSFKKSFLEALYCLPLWLNTTYISKSIFMFYTTKTLNFQIFYKKIISMNLFIILKIKVILCYWSSLRYFYDWYCNYSRKRTAIGKFMGSLSDFQPQNSESWLPKQF